MIEPSYFKNIQNNNVVSMYSKLSQDLTQDIIKRLQNTGDITSYTKSQIKTLQKIGGNEQLMSALNSCNKLSSKRKKELKKMFEDLASQSMKGYATQYARVDAEYKISAEQYTLISSALKRTDKTFKNLTKTIAYNTKRQYVEALDKLYTQVATGSFSYDNAIKNTVTDLANNGVQLQDKAGRNIRLESQVKSNLFTSLTQTANDISKSIGDTIGANCVYIGHTGSCRPTHIPIDAVTLSLKEFKKLEYLTQEPNCYHVVNYDWQEKFDDGKTKVVYEDEHLTKAEYMQNYNLRQTNNYYARQVRYKKEEIQNVKRTGNSEVLDNKKQQLKLAQSKYRQHCLSNGIDLDYSKTWVVGYNK